MGFEPPPCEFIYQNKAARVLIHSATFNNTYIVVILLSTAFYLRITTEIFGSTRLFPRVYLHTLFSGLAEI